MICRRARRLFTLFAVSVLLSAVAAHAQAHGKLPDFTNLVQKVQGAVVNVSTVGKEGTAHGSPGEDAPLDEFLRRFFDDKDKGEIPRFDRESLGSGFILSKDGYIITNHHVVSGADQIIVRLSDRREFEAELIGSDKNSDLAVLKIEAQNLPVVRIGDSQDLQVGSWVLAIGSPFGFEHSVTAGVVSAKGRALPNESYVPFIQTDVAINPGNSGGPLFNMDGEVVGVNSQIFSRTGGYMGLSFAIPSNMAMDVVEQLRAKGRVSRGWLGVYIQDVTRELAESFDMKYPHGALVARVLEDSPASKAGFETGDVIVRYNGEPVDDSASLPPMVGRTPPGREVPVRIVRDGRRQTLQVHIEELPEAVAEDGARPAPERDKNSFRSERLGLTVTVPTDEQRQSSEMGEYGVIARSVEAGPARQAGIRDGDLIVMINGNKIKSLNDFQALVEGLPAGKSVPVLVQRGDAPLFLALKIESQ